MRLPLRITLTVVCITWLATLASPGPLGLVGMAQEESPASLLLDLVNEARLGEGLDPYSTSRLLSRAAQRHADDLSQGSAGLGIQERIREVGYAAWTRDGDQLVVGENLWTGRGTPEEALVSFLADQQDRAHLFSSLYREIGIGVAVDDDERGIYVLDFGARPNVLPIFINDDAVSTENREVAIRLTNERVRPEGQGAGFIGEAIEIRISNEPSFEGLPWQAWAPLVSWTLPATPGEQTVYVQFRDAAGRTAASADSIFFGEDPPPTPTAAPLVPTPTVPSSPPGAAPESEESPTSDAPRTGTPVSSLEGTAVPSGTSAPVMRATPFPTWTPLPSPQPTVTISEDRSEVTLSLPTMDEYRRPLAIAGILQGVAILLGLCWLLLRGKSV